MIHLTTWHKQRMEQINQALGLAPGTVHQPYNRTPGEDPHVFTRTMESTQRKLDNDMIDSRIADKHVLDRQIDNRLNHLYNEGRDIVVENFLSDIFYGAIPMDEDAKEDRKNLIMEAAHRYYQSKGGAFNYISEAVTRTKSPLLENVVKTAKSVSSAVVTRKRKQAKNGEITDVNNIVFDIDDANKDELNYMKEKVNAERITELVKKKVINTVIDERERAEQQKKLEESIEEKVSESVIRHLGSVKEIDSLYSSIMNRNAKVAMESVNVIHASGYSGNSNIGLMPSEDPNAPITDDSYSLDLDLVMAESITSYTMMESMYTLGLEAYTPKEIMAIIESN